MLILVNYTHILQTRDYILYMEKMRVYHYHIRFGVLKFTFEFALYRIILYLWKKAIILILTICSDLTKENG